MWSKHTLPTTGVTLAYTEMLSHRHDGIAECTGSVCSIQTCCCGGVYRRVRYAPTNSRKALINCAQLEIELQSIATMWFVCLSCAWLVFVLQVAVSTVSNRLPRSTGSLIAARCSDLRTKCLYSLSVRRQALRVSDRAVLPSGTGTLGCAVLHLKR